MEWPALVSSHLQHRNPLIVVLGPTAGGKTAFSIDLALWLQSQGKIAEIVNADSRQCFRGMDIGTAKISSQEMHGVPHHLLDVLDPNEEPTIAWYKREAMRVIDAILARGNIPLLVGGSMLYISAIVDGLEPIASADPAIRKNLSAAYNLDDGVTLHRRLAELDPASARAIPQQNKVYLIRALEIIETTGKPVSSQRTSSACPYDCLLLGIDRPHEELLRRIDDRVRTMLANGWVEEVQGLLDRGYTLDDAGMESHGYREIAAALARGMSIEEIKSDTGLAEVIAKKTRQYAKRQKTWWKGDRRICWIDSSVSHPRRGAAES